MSTNLKQNLDSLINNSQTIAIVPHFRPDPDAICSALSLYYYIQTNFPNKKVHILIEGERIETWKELYNYQTIEWVGELGEALEGNDLMIIVDANAFNRVTTRECLPTIKKAIIDHHKTQIDEAVEYKYSDTNAAAATQIIAEELLPQHKELPKEILEILLFGILGDTGSFAFVDKNIAGVLDTAKSLIIAGDLRVETLVNRFEKIDSQELPVIEELLRNTKLTRLVIPTPFGGKLPTGIHAERASKTVDSRLCGNDTKQPGAIPNIMYSFLGEKFREVDSNIIAAAYHRFMHTYLRNVEKYPWGFVVIPFGEKDYKVSFRAMGNTVNVRLIAEAFGGGGHGQASAANIKVGKDEKKTVEEICNEILEQVKEMYLG